MIARLSKILLLVVTLMAGGFTTARATVIPVTTLSDNVAGSLRFAINAAVAGDTISFDLGLNGLLLPITAGELVVDKDLVIQGNGLLNTTLNAANLNRILRITNDASVRLENLSLIDGRASDLGGGILIENSNVTLVNVQITDCEAEGDMATQGGGGIAISGGSLTISGDSELSNNSAIGASGSGGAILILDGAQVTIEGTFIDGNTASRAGGGIELNAGASSSLTIRGANLQGNSTGNAPGNGGGLHVTGMGTVNINRAVFNDNTAAAEGGGLWNGSGTMRLDTVEIARNFAEGDASDQGGAGIFNAGGTLIIDGGIIRGNEATGAAGSGGGILNDAGGNLTVNGATISGNTAVRAGGGIEDNSGDSTTFTLIDVTLDGNATASSPGNGGGVHITGPGDLMISGGLVTNNTASAEGGGLWNGSGLMVIDSVQIMNNTASGAPADQGGGGIFNAGGTVEIRNQPLISGNVADGLTGSGGGILNDMGGNLTVVNSTISGNTSVRAGGGIEDNSGAGTTFTLIDVTLDGNATASSPGNGGGVHITGPGDLMISGGLVTNNTANAEGGGLWNGSGLMVIDSVQIMNNTASGAMANQGGGGIFNAGGTIEINASAIANNMVDGTGQGGGLQNDNNGSVSVMVSTISGNSSATNGGGISNSGSIMITNSTVAMNSTTGMGGGIQVTDTSMIVIAGSIIATNAADGMGQDIAGSGMITSEGYNFIGEDDGDVYTADTTDIEGQAGLAEDPNLGPLADNGGATMTHALQCPSNAVNAGNPNDMSADQRGRMVFDDRRDIGAFELQMMCVVDNTTAVVGDLSGSTLFPNPATARTVRLDIPEPFGNEVTVIVRQAATGQALRERQVGYGAYNLDLSGLSAGTYLVQVYARNSVETHKLMLLNK